jgi:hypothetical protein
VIKKKRDYVLGKFTYANSQDSKSKICVLNAAVLDYHTPGYVSSNEVATENMQGKQDSILNDKFNGKVSP